MEINKKTVMISGALLVVIGSAYPLYRTAQRRLAPGDSGQPRDTSGTGNSPAMPANNSGQYLFDGPVEGGLTAAGRALNSPDTAADTGPGSADITVPAQSPGGGDGGGDGAAADGPAAGKDAASGGSAPAVPGQVRPIAQFPAQNISQFGGGSAGAAQDIARSGRVSAGGARTIPGSARVPAGAAGSSSIGGQRSALGPAGKKLSGRLAKQGAGIQGTIEALAAGAVTGDQAGAGKSAAAGRDARPELPADDIQSPTPPAVSDSGKEEAVELGCNTTRAYCNAPVFVRSWQMHTGKFVGVAHAAGQGCCVYFCAHTRYWWHGKEAQHGPVFDDRETDPASPDYSDGGVGRFCSFAGLPSPGRCSCSLNMLKGGDSCYGQIPAKSCGLPVTVTVPGWKTVYVCKGPPAYCTGR